MSCFVVILDDEYVELLWEFYGRKVLTRIKTVLMKEMCVEVLYLCGRRTEGPRVYFHARQMS